MENNKDKLIILNEQTFDFSLTLVSNLHFRRIYNILPSLLFAGFMPQFDESMPTVSSPTKALNNLRHKNFYFQDQIYSRTFKTLI
jgi:hypothetical protein